MRLDKRQDFIFTCAYKCSALVRVTAILCSARDLLLRAPCQYLPIWQKKIAFIVSTTITKKVHLSSLTPFSPKKTEQKVQWDYSRILPKKMSHERYDGGKVTHYIFMQTVPDSSCRLHGQWKAEENGPCSTDQQRLPSTSQTFFHGHQLLASL